MTDATELARALADTETFLRRYVVFANDEQADAVTLWIAHTWFYDQFDLTPYLAIQSAERRSGKSRLGIECFGLVVRAPQAVLGTSPAALFRVIHQDHPTLLWDETETTFGRRNVDPATEDLRGLLNGGYRRGTPYLRVVGEGKRMRVEKFDVYCPKALLSVGGLPDTVQDRAIVIQLKRRMPSEPVEKFRFRKAELQALPIREWWESLAALPMPDEADVPDELHDRAADNWEPLLAIADTAGDRWPADARRAALVLSGAAMVEDERAGVRLLRDLRELFTDEAADRLHTATILERLLESDRFMESGWSDWKRGRALNAHGLAWLLRDYEIYARPMRIDGSKPLRGYERDQFADAFARYLDPVLESHLLRNSVTPESEIERGSYEVTEKEALQDGSNGAVSEPEELIQEVLERTGGELVEPWQ